MQIKPCAPRSVSCVLVGALLFRPGGVARADADEEKPLPRLTQLEYHVPPGKGCPGPEEFQDLVVPNAKRNPFDKDATALLRVNISHNRDRYEVSFELRDAAGAVVFTEPVEPRVSCDQLVQNLAFQVGSKLKDRRPAPAPAPPPLPVAPPPPQAPPAPPPLTTTPKKETPVVKETVAPSVWALRGAVTGGVGLGVSPTPVAGVLTAELGGQWKITTNVMLSGTLGVLWSPHRSALKPVEMSSTQVEVGTTLVSGIASPCLHWGIGFPWLFGCAGLEVGGLHWEGAQIHHPASAFTVWAALDPRVGVEVPLTSWPRPRIPRFAVRVFGDVPVMLVRPKAVIGQGPSMSTGWLTTVLTTSPVAATFNFGLVGWYDL